MTLHSPFACFGEMPVSLVQMISLRQCSYRFTFYAIFTRYKCDFGLK